MLRGDLNWKKHTSPSLSEFYYPYVKTRKLCVAEGQLERERGREMILSYRGDSAFSPCQRDAAAAPCGDLRPAGIGLVKVRADHSRKLRESLILLFFIYFYLFFLLYVQSKSNSPPSQPQRWERVWVVERNNKVDVFFFFRVYVKKIHIKKALFRHRFFFLAK